MLRIEGPNLSPELQTAAALANFDVKTEHHITILPSELFDRQDKEQDGRQRLDKLADQLAVICAKGFAIHFDSTAYLVEKAKVIGNGESATQVPRKSIIVLVNESCEFAKKVRAVYKKAGFGYDELPFLHTTLFTWPNTDIARKGIGIANAIEWELIKKELFLNRAII